MKDSLLGTSVLLKRLIELLVATFRKQGGDDHQRNGQTPNRKPEEGIDRSQYVLQEGERSTGPGRYRGGCCHIATSVVFKDPP